MIKPKNVGEYIKNSPKEIQPKLEELRKIIKSVLPKSAIEKISYAMPYYGYKGRLIYFAYWKNHIAVYAMPASIKKYKKEIKRYRVSKATLHFPLDKTLPFSLIKKLVKVQLKKNEESSLRK